MDVIPFIQFTLSTQYVMRWIYGGILMFVPVANFFSLGYLSRASRLLMIGSIGLPTWQDRYAIWLEGIKLLFIFILYEAVPFFLFSCGFFLTILGTITGFFGKILIYLSVLGLLVFSFFLPFAFATFAENSDFRRALEFDRVLQAIKEVLIPYAGGYIVSLAALYVCLFWIMRIPYLIGFIVASILTYHVRLVATFYFTQLYRKTSLSSELVAEDYLMTSE